MKFVLLYTENHHILSFKRNIFSGAPHELPVIIFMRHVLLLTFGSYLAGIDQYQTSHEAAFYNQNSQQQWNVAWEALKEIALLGNERILDIGCGSGKVSANIAGRVCNGSVLGLDLSQGMIAFAQKTYAPFYDNLMFTKGDVLELASSSEFDLIFSSSSLHWILDHEPLLIRVYNALKPGGSILFYNTMHPLAGSCGSIS